MKIGTPNNIDVLLYCHVCPGLHPRLHAPAVQEALGFLLTAGAIERNTAHLDTYHTTKLGQAWVRALCNVEKPQVAFVDSHGNILKP